MVKYATIIVPEVWYRLLKASDLAATCKGTLNQIFVECMHVSCSKDFKEPFENRSDINVKRKIMLGLDIHMEYQVSRVAMKGYHIN